MLKWRRRRVKPVECLGLDINPTQVTLVQLSNTGSTYQLKAHSQAKIQYATSTPTQASAVEPITQAIQTALASLDTSYQNVIIAMPDTTVISQQLQIDPAIADQEAAVLLAAAPGIPKTLDQVSLDFQLLHQTQSDLQQQTVLCVACLKTALDTQLQAITASGLRIQIVEVASHALERVCRQIYPLPTLSQWVLIEINLHTLTILLWEKQQVIAVSTDYLQDPYAPQKISLQAQQMLGILLLKKSVSRLDTIGMIGNNPLLKAVEQSCKVTLSLENNPMLLPSNPILDCSVSHFNQLYLAIGLALRAYETTH